MRAYIQCFGGCFSAERQEMLCRSLEAHVSGLTASTVPGSGNVTPGYVRCTLVDLPLGFEPIARVGAEPGELPFEPTEAIPGFETKAQAIVSAVLRHLSDTLDHQEVNRIRVLDDRYPEQCMCISWGAAAIQDSLAA